MVCGLVYKQCLYDLVHAALETLFHQDLISTFSKEYYDTTMKWRILRASTGPLGWCMFLRDFWSVKQDKTLESVILWWGSPEFRKMVISSGSLRRFASEGGLEPRSQTVSPGPFMWEQSTLVRTVTRAWGSDVECLQVTCYCSELKYGHGALSLFSHCKNFKQTIEIKLSLDFSSVPSYLPYHHIRVHSLWI